MNSNLINMKKASALDWGNKNTRIDSNELNCSRFTKWAIENLVHAYRWTISLHREIHRDRHSFAYMKRFSWRAWTHTATYFQKTKEEKKTYEKETSSQIYITINELNVSKWLEMVCEHHRLHFMCFMIQKIITIFP